MSVPPSLPLAEVLGPSVAGYWGTEAGSTDVDAHMVRNGDVLSSGAIRWEALPLRGLKTSEFERAQVHAGDLVLTTSGYCGQVAHVQAEPSTPVCVTNFVRRLRPNPDVMDSRYLFHFMNLESFRSGLAPYIRGTTMKNLSLQAAAAAVHVPVPRLEEQRRIAAVLDQADELRAKRRAALALLDTLTESIFRSATTWNTESRLVGPSLIFLTSGARGWAKYYAESGSRFIRSLDVRMNSISDSDPAWVVAPSSAESRRIQARAGDVLLTITGSRIGRVAVVPERLDGCFVSQHVAILRLDPTALDPAFTARFLSLPSGGQRQILQSQYGQTKPGLNFEQIRRFEVPALELSQQQAVMAQVRQSEAAADLGHGSLERLNTLFASLQQRAFRGEL